MRRTVMTSPTSTRRSRASALAGLLLAGAILALAGCGSPADTRVGTVVTERGSTAGP